MIYGIVPLKYHETVPALPCAGPHRPKNGQNITNSFKIYKFSFSNMFLNFWDYAIYIVAIAMFPLSVIYITSQNSLSMCCFIGQNDK
jgi:hypothetical protein